MKQIEISREELINFIEKLKQFNEDKTTKALQLSDKELHIMTMTRIMYLQNKKDKGLQYANKIMMKTMDKMLKNIEKSLKELKA